MNSTTLFFAGFQARGTTGHEMQRAARKGNSNIGSVRLDHEDVRVRANIETISGLSAHADRLELRRWVSAIPQPRVLTLHHGEVEAQRIFFEWLGG